MARKRKSAPRSCNGGAQPPKPGKKSKKNVEGGLGAEGSVPPIPLMQIKEEVDRDYLEEVDRGYMEAMGTVPPIPLMQIKEEVDMGYMVAEGSVPPIPLMQIKQEVVEVEELQSPTTIRNENRLKEFLNERENVNYRDACEEEKGLERSGCTDLDKAVLNDEYKSQAATCDESYRRILGRGEDRQMKEDDQRCEIEVNIEVNNAAIRDLELLIDQMGKLSVAERKTFRPFNDDSFPWVYRKTITSMYSKEEGLRKIEELKTGPSKIIPEFLEQLRIRKQKLEEKKNRLYLNKPKYCQVLEHENIVKKWKEASERSLEVQLENESKDQLLAENKTLADENATLEAENKEWKEKYDAMAKDLKDRERLILKIRAMLEASTDGSERSLKAERTKLLKYLKAYPNLLTEDLMSAIGVDLREVTGADDSNEEAVIGRSDATTDPNEQLLKLKDSPSGKLAVIIFDIIVYIKAEPIQRDFFNELLLKLSNHWRGLKNVNIEKINEAVKLLERNNLLFVLKEDEDQELLKIEPDAQEKRKSFLASDAKEEDTLAIVLLMLRADQEESFLRKCIQLAVNVWPVAWNYPKLVKLYSQHICEVVKEMKNMENGTGLIDQGIEFGNKALKKIQEVLGENHLHCFDLQINISLGFYMQGNMEESAKMFKELARKVKESPHGEFSGIFKRIHALLSTILTKLGSKNLDEALVIQRNCLEKCKEEFGEHHAKTLEAEFNFGKTLLLKGDNKMALDVLKHVEQNKTKLLGGNDITVLETRLAIARTNLQLGNMPEAWKTIMSVYNKLRPIWEQHVEFFTTVCIFMGSTLNRCKDYKKTLKLRGRYEEIKKTLNVGHPMVKSLCEIIEHAQRKK